MPVDGASPPNGAERVLRIMDALDDLQKPFAVVRSATRSRPLSEAFNLNYMQLARLHSAPMGSILALAKAPKVERLNHRRPSQRRDTR